MFIVHYYSALTSRPTQRCFYSHDEAKDWADKWVDSTYMIEFVEEG